MKTADYPVWLAVPLDQRDAAKADAGKHPDGRNAIAWDKEAQLWYARPGADLSRLTAWLPDRSIRSSGGGDPQSEFLDALTSAGLILDDLPIMDGRKHRVPVVEGKKGNLDGVYKGFTNGYKPGGWFINYHRADNDQDITKWKASGSPGKVDPLARIHIRAVMRQSQDDTAREQAAVYARQTAKAYGLISKMDRADPGHAYLVRKGVTAAEDLRLTNNGALAIPLYNADGEFRTLQYIPPTGKKYLFTDAPKSGHFRVEGGPLVNGEPVLYAEGYATARSLYMVTGRPVVMTVDAGNMAAVGEILKVHFPDSPHLFMADLDHANEKNKGLLSAQRSAAAVGGAVIVPDLRADEIDAGLKDFNDLHQSRGIDALRASLLPQINEALISLNYKDSAMAKPDGASPAPENTEKSKPATRRPGAALEHTDAILKLSEEGLKASQIAKELGIGQTSVYRILKAQQAGISAAPAISEPAAVSVTSEPAAVSVTSEPAAVSVTSEPAVLPVTPEPVAVTEMAIADRLVAGISDLPAPTPEAGREPLTLYHGSPSAFSAIDTDKIGLGQNFVGRGFYTDTSAPGVHYAMEEINHTNYYVYELNIPADSVILDRFDSSSLTNELRERIRDAGKKVDQQLTNEEDSSQSGLGDKLADSEKIDATFFMHASTPRGMSILKEAGVDALKDNSYIAVINTDCIENVRLRSASGDKNDEMAQYVDNALSNSVENAARLPDVLQANPEYAIYYHAIRLELIKQAKNQGKPEEAERLISLLTHTLIETVDSGTDRKTNITPLNRLYAEALKSLDLMNDDKSATLSHLIDSAVVNINPEKNHAAEPGQSESAEPAPDLSAQVTPAPEALQKSDAAPEIAALPENSASDVPDKTSHSEPVAVITGTPAASDNDADSPAPPVSSVSPAPVAASASETPESDMSGASDTFSDASAAEEQASEITQTSVAEADVTPDAELIVNAEAHPAASADTAPPENVPRAEPAQPGPAAFGEENAIYVGAQRVAPQPEDAPAQNASRIDQDKLLSRLSHERHSDGKSVIYSLDNTPAFTDRGNRLVMAEGASADEEKVLAALLNAAKFYHGKIELTGSDEFKAFAINVIVNNGLQVSMKNPGQQLALEEAKRLAGQPAAVPDMVRGEPVAAPVTAAASPVPPATPVAQPVTAASPETPAVPVSAPVSSENSKPMPATPVSDATISSPTKPTIRPDIHTPAESAREPVTGKVTAHGQAPFRFEQGNQESVFITLRTREGSQTFWGKELAGLIRDTRLRDGQMVTLQWMGQQPVTVNKPLKDRDGNFTGDYEPVQTNRNQWALTSVRGTRVQTGGDEMLKLSAFSANRYTQIQHAVASQLNIALSAPPKPADGLYWFRPDGQGSSSAGDALSALRPDHNQHAGKAVMSAWGADGKPDLYLVQGDGQYLQGVLRQGDTYQHVLASLPDRKDAPKMVINILTPEGAKPVGSGNGVNRSDGKPIPREHVAFRVTGDEKVRIAKLQEPASIPPALHARLGYDERYKAEPVYPKEQPAAALQATPATINRPA